MISDHYRILATLLCLLGLGGATASERLLLQIGTATQAGWAAHGIQLELDLSGEQAAFRIERLQLPQPVGELRQIEIHCETSQLLALQLQCRNTRFQADHAQLGRIAFRGMLRFHRHAQKLELTIQELPWGYGRLQGQLSWQDGTWSLQGRATAIDLRQAQELLAHFIQLPASEIQGQGQARFQLQGHNTAVISGQIDIETSNTTLSSSSGRVAGEDLAVRLGVSLQKQGEYVRFLVEGSSTQGQLYVEPVFIDAGAHPFNFKTLGDWTTPDQTLRLSDLRLHQPDVLTAEALLEWQAGTGLKRMDIWLREAILPGAYQLYAQPFLIGTPFDSLVSSGRFKGLIYLSDNKFTSLRLGFDDLNLVDTDARFRLHQLGGLLRWQAQPAAGLLPSELHWSSGALGNIAFGGVRAQLRTQGGLVELQQPVQLPVLDGALTINTLHIEQLGQPNMRLQFDAALSPIQLQPISRALGWPEFGGTIAGRLPSMHYQHGQLSLGGRLEVAAFNGQIHVDDLQIEQPLGRVPRLSADIALERLDLRALTETFSFGRIEGKLSGHIDQLRLINWQPASFDAHFYTPPDDRSRHRISQRAIQNLSSIGGGGAAALLSRGFLSFFKDFAYDRIGLRCTLRQEICQISGIEPAENGGYYIVIGRWLPRVDVIGFQREVSWPTLIEQLKSVIQSEGPAVK